MKMVEVLIKTRCGGKAILYGILRFGCRGDRYLQCTKMATAVESTYFHPHAVDHELGRCNNGTVQQDE